MSLIFLFLINSFASKVSDNDGSAFITKNEFDSLKSSFQSRIDEYNRNIDNKIDVAIASYLKGIILSNEYSLRNYWKEIVADRNIYWTADTSFGNTNKPYPAQEVKYVLHSKNSGYIWKCDGNGVSSLKGKYMDKMPYGYYDITNSIFRLEYEKDIKQTVSWTFFMGYNVLIPTEALDYVPDCQCANGKLSLVNRSGFFAKSFDPKKLEAESYRNTMYEYAIAEQMTDNSIFYFAPKGNVDCYYYDKNSNDTVSGITNNAISVAYNYDASAVTEDSAWKSSVGGNWQNITYGDNKVGLADFSLSDVKFGWMNNKSKYKDMNYQIVTEITGDTNPIKKGVKLTDSTYKGDVVVKFGSGTVDGKFLYKVENEPNVDFSGTSGYSTYTINSTNRELHIPINSDGGGSVYFIFLPNTASGGKLDINSVSVIVKK